MPSTRGNSNIHTNVTSSSNAKYYVNSSIKFIADVLHITGFQWLISTQERNYYLPKWWPREFVLQITDYAYPSFTSKVICEHRSTNPTALLWSPVPKIFARRPPFKHISASLQHWLSSPFITNTFKPVLPIILQIQLVTFHVKIWSLLSLI
jgi:hypothetical protein